MVVHQNLESLDYVSSKNYKISKVIAIASMLVKIYSAHAHNMSIFLLKEQVVI
jgi:hypothetical protein